MVFSSDISRQLLILLLLLCVLTFFSPSYRHGRFNYLFNYLSLLFMRIIIYNVSGGNDLHIDFSQPNLYRQRCSQKVCM